MKSDQVTVELFAEWSFIRDVEVGVEEGIWSELPQEIRDLYIEEAEYYMMRPPEMWPEDILERLDS